MLRKSLRPKNVVQAAPEVRRGPTKITVPLASRDLESGTQITLDDVALFRLSRQEMKEHGIKRVFMSNPDQIIGKTVAVDLARGSTFDTKDFFAPGTGPGIADKLEPGQRAVTINVSATSALLGFAGAGQNVDVLFHFGQNSGSTNGYGNYGNYSYNNYDLNDRYAQGRWRPPHFDYNAPRGLSSQGGINQFRGRQQNRQGGGGVGVAQKYQSATVTLVQKATILALGQRAIQTGNSSQLAPEERVRVTLAVKPESAELIRVAEGHGELSLTLRGAGDDEVVQTKEPATLASIIKMEEEPVVEIPRQEVRDIDIFRGQNRSQVRFTRDRDTGKDDFQRWILLRPKQPSGSADNPNQTNQDLPDPNQPDLAGPDTGGQSGSSSRNSGSSSRNNGSSSNNTGSSTRTTGGSGSSTRSTYQPNNYQPNNYPNGILIEDEQWSAQQRLESDFRKIRTLFNRNPELRDQFNRQPNSNVDAPRPNESNDLSTKSTSEETRSAKVIELYDPRSWE